MIEAEVLLAVTGLILPRDEKKRRSLLRSSVVASREVVPNLLKKMRAVLDRDDQTGMRVVKVESGFEKKLAAGAGYPDLVADLEDKIGLPAAGAFQEAHANAVAILQSRRPATSIVGVAGLEIQPNDPVSEAIWLLECDMVESVRIVNDFASCALLPETVEVFSQCFPDIYAKLAKELADEVTKRHESGWVATHWLDFGIRMFLQAPEDGVVDLYAPTAPPPPAPEAKPAAPGGGKTKLPTAALQTAGNELPKGT